MPELLQIQLERGVALDPVQERFQLGPMLLLAGDESPEVDDHRGKWSVGVKE